MGCDRISVNNFLETFTPQPHNNESQCNIGKPWEQIRMTVPGEQKCQRLQN